DEWIIRERQLGNCGNGSVEEQKKIAIKSFEEKVQDKDAPKKRRGRDWLIGIFKGVEDRLGRFQTSENSWKRQKTVETADDLRQARFLSDSASAASSRVHDEQLEANRAKLYQSTPQPEIPDHLVRPCNRELNMEMDDDITYEMQRDILAKEENDARIAEQEDHDDHLAQQAARVRAQAAQTAIMQGRPKKTKAEVLVDLQKLVRDRCQMVKDTKEKIERSKKNAEDEADELFGKKRSDEAAALRTAFENEIDAYFLEFDALHKKTSETDLAPLLSAEEVDLADAKKKVIDQTKDAYSKLKTDAEKSVGTYKKGVRRIGKSIKVKDSSTDVPALTQKLREVVSANPGDPNSGVTVVAKPGTEYNGEVVLIKPDAAFSFEMTAMT
ncbi:unnamed protein product, partial [Prorocentrum cordatum]